MSFISDIIIQWGPLITAIITALIAYITLKVSRSANKSADDTYELNKQALKISTESKELNNQTLEIMNETRKINEQTLEIIKTILELNKDVYKEKRVQDQQAIISSLKKCFDLLKVEKDSIKSKNNHIKELINSSKIEPIGALRTEFLDNIQEETKKHDFHVINGSITLLEVEVNSLNNKINKHDLFVSIPNISKNEKNFSEKINSERNKICGIFNKIKSNLDDLEGLISNELEKELEKL